MHKTTFPALPFLAAGLFAQGTPEVEPNNTFTAATAIANRVQGNAAIDIVGDVDFWRVTLTTRADLRFWVNPGIGTSLANSDLALVAADGTTVLAFNDDSVSPASWLSTIVANDIAPGAYYLRVRSSQAFDPNGTGSYTIDVIAAPPGTYGVAGGGGAGIPIPVMEGAESNDPRQLGGVATPSFENSVNFGDIASPALGTGFVDPLADYDFYRIDVTRQGLLTMETLPSAAFPAMRDSTIFLVNATLAPIAFDDDGGFGRFSRLVHYVTPATYYVVVNGREAGNYVLNILLSPMAPSGRASVTVRSGGCGPTLGVRQTVTGPVVRTEVPVLGSAFYLDCANMPPNALTIRVIGTDPLPVPYDLTAVGAPGCLLEVDPIDQSLSSANPSGIEYWVLNTPLRVWLVGLTLEQQVAVVDLAANPLGLTTSNRVSSICGMHH